MSRRKRKPSKADYKALQRNSPLGVRFPPDGGSAEPRMQRQSRSQRKRDNEGDS